MPQGIDHDDQDGRRKSPRALFRAEVHFSHQGRRCRVSILDVSMHGLKIRAIHKLQVGDEFWIKLPGLTPMPATVSWARDFVVGCQLAKPLHPAMYEALITGTITEKRRDSVKAKPSKDHMIAV